MVELLEERPAHALRGAAAHLSLDERGVQRAADVLRDDVAEQLTSPVSRSTRTCERCAATDGAPLVCAEPPCPSIGS